MNDGEIALEKYVITKSLTKTPEDYPDAKNQPHVQVKISYSVDDQELFNVIVFLHLFILPFIGGSEVKAKWLLQLLCW